MELWLLNNMPTVAIAVVIVGGVVLLALAGSVLTHRRHPQLADGEHNDMVGVVLGIYGAIYGIILAFVVVTLWTQVQDADVVVRDEASSLAQLTWDSEVFPPSRRDRVHAAVGAYAHKVVDVQWPLMRTGTPQYSVAQREMRELFAALQTYEPRTERERAFYREAIDDLNEVVAQRRARMAIAGQELPGLLKTLVYGGALAFIPLTFLYGINSRRVQLLFVGSVAALIGFSLLLVVVLDHPFAGNISVDTTAYKVGPLAQFW
ncbi:DUF4239 domain-containing protein [Streptomyces spectabilis]|uniref:DUF4239 domain-containing protein n=1 Tax=Streptomyces spectabilis TaxID=68270 RepID=A0A516R0N8_STRST|nr:DUF4239 domain-containing protein [Streptomyces spectabilis]QDQ09200.1 DUF4239 domain-containing protein [Streptomyces spectabilis]